MRLVGRTCPSMPGIPEKYRLIGSIDVWAHMHVKCSLLVYTRASWNFDATHPVTWLPSPLMTRCACVSLHAVPSLQQRALISSSLAGGMPHGAVQDCAQIVHDGLYVKAGCGLSHRLRAELNA